MGGRLLILKEAQHLTRAWLTLKRTISRTPYKEAQKSHIPFQNFGESRFRGSCKTPFPDKKSCIFPNPARYFSQIPDPENTLQTLFG